MASPVYRVLISQMRVADLLRRRGWKEPKKEIYGRFAEFHERIPGLRTRLNRHRPAKLQRAIWYQYESAKPMSANDAENELAKRLASLLHL